MLCQGMLLLNLIRLQIREIRVIRGSISPDQWLAEAVAGMVSRGGFSAFKIGCG